MIPDIPSNEKRNPIVTQLLIKRKKLFILF